MKKTTPSPLAIQRSPRRRSRFTGLRGQLPRAVRSLAAVGLLTLVAGAVSPVGSAGPGDAVTRGRYLAYHVASCFICHGERDFNRYAGPLVEGQEGRGASIGYLGIDRHAPNVTPAALADWSDAEIGRALSHGRSRDGAPVHAFLDGNPYRFLTPTDVEALVTLVRALEPIEQDAPKAPEMAPAAGEEPLPPEPWPTIDPEDTVSRGAYLVAVGSCRFCHGDDYSGGKTFQLPGRDPIAPANISPAPGTATGGRSREAFIGRFEAFASEGARRLRAPEPASSTVMPWTDLGRMTAEDLGAIYDFLQTVEPIE